MPANELRPVVEADRDLLRHWRNQPDVRRFMYTDHVISEDEHAAWFARALTRDDARFWVIRSDGQDVGLVNLYDIDRRHGTCFWAFYIGETDVRGKGVGAFTEFTTLERVFGELGLRKLCCEVLDTNPAVIALHERFGFTREGVFRAQIVKEDGPVDVVRLGLLADEWAAVRDGHREALGAKGIL
jgi:UDP-4-amino-4,6-dideoxy-N-acetyl-beta-L-altrosamine N-acetyltransferase